MTISKELHDRVMNKVQECIDKILGPGTPLVIPVTYRTNMNRTAGYAYFKSKRIELNEPLFLHNIEEFFTRTIPHEVAHIMQVILYPNAKQAHGPEWRKLMTLLGAPVKRTHSYDVSVCTTMERFRYTCNCSERSFFLTKILHNKIIRGQKKYCNFCTGLAVYTPEEN